MYPWPASIGCGAVDGRRDLSQHIFSRRSFGVASVSNSEQSQSLRENAQLLGDATVYSEDTSNGITTAKYDETLQAKSWLTITAGARTSIDRLNYRVEQPLGIAKSL